MKMFINVLLVFTCLSLNDSAKAQTSKFKLDYEIDKGEKFIFSLFGNGVIAKIKTSDAQAYIDTMQIKHNQLTVTAMRLQDLIKDGADSSDFKVLGAGSLILIEHFFLSKKIELFDYYTNEKIEDITIKTVKRHPSHILLTRKVKYWFRPWSEKGTEYKGNGKYLFFFPTEYNSSKRLDRYYEWSSELIRKNGWV